MTFEWTDENVSLLKRMWLEDGMSCSQIAAVLGRGCSRNAVIGKIHRLHITFRGDKTQISEKRGTGTERPKRQAGKIIADRVTTYLTRHRSDAVQPAIIEAKRNKTMRGKAGAIANAANAIPNLPPQLERLYGRAWDVLPGSVPVVLIDLPDHSACKWGVGEDDGGPQKFCGLPCERHTKPSYCPVHMDWHTGRAQAHFGALKAAATRSANAAAREMPMPPEEAAA